MAVTTKTIVDRYKQAAEDHNLVEWFDFNTADFLFDGQTDLEYPCVFLQLTGGTIVESTREERNFTLYSLQRTPDSFEYVKSGPYDYFEAKTTQRDEALQILRDIMRKVQLENLKDMLVEEGSIVFDNNSFSGATGWRIDFTVVTVADYDVDADFPESE